MEIDRKTWIPWIPKELKGWGTIRSLAGVWMPPQWTKQPGPEAYLDLYRDRVLDLIKREKEITGTDPEIRLEDLVVGWVTMDHDPEDLLNQLWEMETWENPGETVYLFLKGNLSLEDVLNRFQIRNGDKPNPLVSVKMFREELDEETLHSLLEVTAISL